MKVREVMLTDVKTCFDYNPLNTAAEVMWENDCGCLPVIDRERHVLGMITDRDACMAAYIRGLPLDQIPVTTAMSKHVYFVSPDDDLRAAEEIMREHQVRRLPVLDDCRRLMGIVTLNDIAREAERERATRRTRQVADLEVAHTLASVCEPRHPIAAAQAA
jgi:CBS domain-containing protein